MLFNIRFFRTVEILFVVIIINKIFLIIRHIKICKIIILIFQMEIKNLNKIINNKHNNKANNNHKIKIVFNKKKRKNQKSQKNN